MAGIGFALRRLTNQDNLIGIFRAYTHATVVSAGPWLCTVLALGSMYPMGADPEALAQINNFQIIVVYNFVASLILSAPVFMVITRCLADCIYGKNVTPAPSLLLASIGIVYLLLAPFAAFFYGYYVEMGAAMRALAVANLYLISLIWIVSVYISALRNYKSITRAFFVGMLVAVVFSQSFPDMFGENSLLVWLNLGMAWIAFSLMGKIFTEYPYKLTGKLGLKKSFLKYWDLALWGVVYNTAIWIDKCMMWVFAPEALTLANNMTYYPHYDSAMFLAYLTVIPSMAIFIFSIETSFFTKYQKFYHDILTHKTLSVILENQRKLIAVLMGSARNFLVVQGVFTLVAILASAKIFTLFKLPFLEIGIFRVGVLASFFHVFALFEMVVLSYFDCRKKVLWLQILFFATNALFTYISIQMGFNYYGFGYFFASLVTAAVTSLVLYDHLQRLPYHSFITSNTSV